MLTINVQKYRKLLKTTKNAQLLNIVLLEMKHLEFLPEQFSNFYQLLLEFDAELLIIYQYLENLKKN